MNKEELKEILDKHKKWWLDEEGGQRADLQGADLQGADLRGADLQGADLQGAYLQGADLQGADLQGADLQGAYLQRADLQGAYLQGAYLRGAYLRGADLQGAENVKYAIHCPDTGSFIAWKKAYSTIDEEKIAVIIKLGIPEDARRSSSTTNKCRCDKALVLEIQSIDGDILDIKEAKSEKGGIYKVGEIIEPDSWDEDRWNECSHGIHFFVTRQEAEWW